MKAQSFCLIIVIPLTLAVSTTTFAQCALNSSTNSPQCVKQKATKATKAVKEKKEDENIPLSQVPEKIKEIAAKAVKGLKLTEAELEDGVYELKGYVDGEKYEIKINRNGKVIKKEKDNDDDDSGDDDDD